MKNLDELFALDESATEGQWIDFGDGDADAPGFKVRFVDQTSIAFLKIKNKHAKQFRKMIENGLLSEANDRLIMVRSMCEAGLVDWRNVALKGEVVPFSFDAAVQLFTDPRFSRLYVFVATACVDETRFRPSEAIAGN